MKRFTITVGLIMISLSLLISHLPQQAMASSANTSIHRNMNLILVEQKSDISSAAPYIRALGSIGIKLQVVEKQTAVDWRKVRMAVVPAQTAASLSAELQETLVKEARNGLKIVTEGPSTFSQKLGVELGKELREVKDLIDTRHRNTLISWNEAKHVQRFSIKGGQVFISDRISKAPVAAGARIGLGSYIYLALPLDEPDSWGINRFPYFHEAMLRFFDFKPEARIDRLSVYLDWGYVYDQDPVKLAANLKSKGVHKVFLSSWYDLKLIKEFYHDFITAAHANGMLVYSWYEFPMVTKQFWDQHPQWRQKTASGEDAHVDWRYLMALEDPDCMQAVKQFIRENTLAFKWDGVNLAELYFESPNTWFEQSGTVTPMSNDFRKSFNNKHQFDPIDLFKPNHPSHYKVNPDGLNAYIEARTALITKQHEELLGYMASQQWSRELDFIVTTIDTSLDSTIGQEVGVDLEQLLSLKEKYRFEIVLQDPFMLWSEGPDRYRIMVENYVNNHGNRDVSLDINVVDRQTKGKHATLKQTGLELTVLMSEAASLFKSVAVYDNNLHQSLEYLYAPFALGSNVDVENMGDSLRVQSASSFIYTGRRGDGMEAMINGRHWPFRSNNGILLPKGSYTVKFQNNAHTEGNWFADFSGENVSGRRTLKGIELSYNESHSVFIEVEKLPEKVMVGSKVILPYTYYRNGNYVMKLPPGKNTVQFIRLSREEHIAVQGVVSRLSASWSSPKGTKLYRLEELAGAAGLTFAWDVKHQSFTMSRDGYHIWGQVGSKTAKANGKTVVLPEAPRVDKGKLMVPIRFIFEGLNYSIRLDEKKTYVVEKKAK